MKEILNDMAESLCWSSSDVCFDSAYTTRNLRNIISNMGSTPFIKPKINTLQPGCEASFEEYLPVGHTHNMVRYLNLKTKYFERLNKII